MMSDETKILDRTQVKLEILSGTTIIWIGKSNT